MSAVDSARRPVFLAVLLLAAAVVPAAAQEPTLVRLNDAVGDTIDLAERDSFHLFPKTAGIQHAVILALSGPEFFAEITRAGADSTANIFLRIMPNDLERIRFLIDNHENVAAQQRSDSTYAQALASFWRTIEDSPFRNMAGDPAIAREVPRAPPEVVPPGEPAATQEVHPGPPEAVTAGEPQAEPVAVVVRLRDAVGDTIDLAERDSFHLFPNTAGFRQAVILALPGPEFFAKITRTGADCTGNIFLGIMPTDLERIRFLIDNHRYVAEQQQSDSTYAQALASFWQTIEEHPPRSMAGEPAIAQEVPPAPTEAAAAGEPPSQPVTIENRYNYTLLGTTLGSVAGGLLGSAGSGWTYRVWPPLSQPVFLTVACGATALGSYAGYKYGNRLDRKSVARPLPSEGRGWRTCCAIGACVPGLGLGGAVTAALVGATGNEGGLTLIPAILSGLCVTVEVVTLGYQVGRSIDRNNTH